MMPRMLIDDVDKLDKCIIPLQVPVEGWASNFMKVRNDKYQPE